jgi:tRNA (guanine37-N1)-methyltransferase
VSSAVWNVEILTIFPQIFDSFLSTSLVGKAVTKGVFSPTVTDIRSFAEPPHFKVDDTPYGGGPGMVMSVPPLVQAIESAKSRLPLAHVVLFSPAGEVFTQKKAVELSRRDNIILVCGRYEGIDQRVVDSSVDEELSIGEYVLMGGEVPAMVVIEAGLRLRPDAIHNSLSIENESFSAQMEKGALLEAPQYTRPEEFRGMRVPDVLLSGNHKEIEKWRLEQSKIRSALRKKT